MAFEKITHFWKSWNELTATKAFNVSNPNDADGTNESNPLYGMCEVFLGLRDARAMQGVDQGTINHNRLFNAIQACGISFTDPSVVDNILANVNNKLNQICGTYNRNCPNEEQIKFMPDLSLPSHSANLIRNALEIVSVATDKGYLEKYV